jgi:hypothetical protein
VSSSKKPFVRRNRNLLDTPIHSNQLTSRNGILNFLLDNNMQEGSAIPDKKVSRTFLPRKILLKILRHFDLKFEPTVGSQQRYLVFIKPECHRTSVIPDTCLLGLGTVENLGFPFLVFSLLVFFLLKSPDGFDCFKCFISGRAAQLRRQGFTGGLVGFVVQGDAIEVVFVPRYGYNVVESTCISNNSLLQLLQVLVEFEFDKSREFHSLHIGIRNNYTSSFVEFEKSRKYFSRARKEECGNSSPPTRAVLRTADNALIRRWRTCALVGRGFLAA